MGVQMISRRELIQLGLFISIPAIASCSNDSTVPIFRTSEGILLKELIRSLPKPWVLRPLKINSEFEPDQLVIPQNTDLVAIGDGWVSQLSKESIRPIEAKNLSSRLNRQAQMFLKGFGSELASKIFPIGVSPWVMLFRNGDPWLSRARKGWNVLLDSELTGKVVFPASPRVVISIANQIDDSYALKKLRIQALTFDDRDSLNWVLSGKARVAILPLYRCFLSLIKDPRLTVVFPVDGVPLNWTVLVRPHQTKQLFPAQWIEDAWQVPQLGRLLSQGWIPPISYLELTNAMHFVPDTYKSIILPAEAFWERCWSFPLISDQEKTRLERLWIQSSP